MKGIVWKYISLIVLLLLLLFFTSQLASAITSDSFQWWDTSRPYRVSVTVNTMDYERYEKPVEVSLNFTQLLSTLGQTGILDENSIRVIETDSTGVILNAAVLFQFDKDPGFNAATRAAGTIVFIMDGTTQSNVNRHYHIYFGLTGGSYSPLPITPQVTLTDNITDEGQLSYRIGTAGSTYYFQKQAGGFSSLVDVPGNDWIGYNATRTGSSGTYRGIPNAIYPEGYFHPGFNCCTSNIVTQGPIKVQIRSVSNDGTSESIWDFYPGYATMTMVKSKHSYWWLYEGTPGGALEPNMDFMVRSDGTQTLLSQSTYGDITNHEWAYFGDPGVGRSLFVSHHEDDTLQDEYWSMESNMTVFGFGRTISSLTGLLSSVPQHFTIGLMEGTGFAQNSKTVYSAYKDMVIIKGSAEQYGSVLPPTIITQPAGQTVNVGKTATFSVTAAGAAPLSYQWQKNGTNITGATAASYTTPAATLADNGATFRVVVKNSLGSVTSNAATLTVTAALANNVNNPGFESGTSAWSFFTSGTGTFSVVSPGFEGANAARLALSSGGSNIQLYQTGIALEPNTQYRLSFAGYSSSGHDMTVRLIKHESPYTPYMPDFTPNLGTAWQTFTAEFTTGGTAVNDGRLQFWLAQFAAAGDSYYMDDIRLEKVN
jgi:hypothetical protein